MRGFPVRGEVIRAARKSLGLTQEQLALKAECDPKTVRKAEKSGHVDQSTVDSLSAALGIPRTDLIDGPALVLEEANLQVAQSWFAAFNQRKPEVVAELFHEDGSVTVMADENLPGGGRFAGRDGVLRWAAVCFAAMRTEPMTPDMFQFDPVGQFVFARSIREIQVTSLQTQKSVTASAAHEFRIERGRILSHRIFADSDAIARLVRDSA